MGKRRVVSLTQERKEDVEKESRGERHKCSFLSIFCVCDQQSLIGKVLFTGPDLSLQCRNPSG